MDNYFKQINGVAMGTKMRTSYANLFIRVGYIEHQFNLPIHMSLWWPIHIINSVDKIKLSYYYFGQLGPDLLHVHQSITPLGINQHGCHDAMVFLWVFIIISDFSSNKSIVTSQQIWSKM